MTSPVPSSSVARRPSRTTRRILAVTSIGLAGLLVGLLAGCSAGIANTTSSSSYTEASGNWQFKSTASAAARLSSLGGSLTVDGTTVSGILHPLSATGQCLSTSTPVAVAGSIDLAGHLTISGPISRGTFTLSGTLSTDRKTLTGATYTVSGGDCAFPADKAVLAHDDPSNPASPVTAQQYQPVNGTYAGTLTTRDGETFSLSSTLTQASQPDADGIYHVTGTAASPGNTCLPTSLPATASTIDGGNISTTYTDPATGTSIIATGTTSPDGTTITIASWSITSVCGSDSGIGILSRQ